MKKLRKGSAERKRGFRVAMVLASPFPAPRGTQSWVLELCRALAGEGHEIHLFCYGGSLGGGIPPEIIIHRARILPGIDAGPDSRPSIDRPLNDMMLLGSLLSKLKKIKPDIIHSHNHEGGIAGILAGNILGIPVVHQVHGSLSEELEAWTGHHFSEDRGLSKKIPDYSGQDDPGRMKKMIIRSASVAGAFIDRAVPAFADAVLTLDHEAIDAASINPSKAFVFPPGVSIPKVLNSDRDESPELNRVVYSGNLDPYQSIDLLAEAWPEVLCGVKDAVLEIVTHDVLQKPFIIPEARIMRVSGLNEAVSRISRASCLVIPRKGGGGYPLKMLNALGMGIPVVACRESAKGLDERSGVIPVEPNPLSLAEAIIRILLDNNLRKELSENALSFAREHPWSRVAKLAATAYERALNISS